MNKLCAKFKLYLMRLDLDESGSYEGHTDCEDDEPEGKINKCFLVGEHIEEGGEPGVELVKGPNCGFLASRVVDTSAKVVRGRVGVSVVRHPF